MRSAFFSILLCLLWTGCDSPNDPAMPVPDMAMAPDLAPPPPDMELPRRDPTDHPPALQLSNYGGPTIAAMAPYTIVWKGDEALGAKVHAFISFLVQSDYWVQVSGEYGGGKGTPQQLIVLDAAPPASMDDADFEPLIAELVSSGKISNIDANTMLFFIVPASTQVTEQGEKGCFSFGGYHHETQASYNGQLIPFAVNLQCSGSGLTPQGFDELTVTISHEGLEAQSDPLPFHAPAWVNYQSPLGGEVGDLCVFTDTSITAPGQAGLPGTDYRVTTSYSQKAAIAGDTDPCQPTPSGQVYFNVAVSPPNIMVSTDASGLGDATAEYQPFAYGDVGTIKWSLAQPPGNGVKITPTSGTAKAGDTIALSVHTTQAAQAGPHPFTLAATSSKGGSNFYNASITVQ